MDSKKRIYLDHAATTPLCDEARHAMLECLTAVPGNASGIYASAREAKRHLEAARAQTAQALHANPDEIYFTSGGSESDNWALKGIAAKAGAGCHIVTSMIEHPAVLNTCAFLERHDCAVTYVRPDHQGRVNPSDIAAAIRPETVLISIMWANNEIGTIEPVADIARIAHEAGALFHTDAVQAAGTLPIDVHAAGIDLLSLSAHKFYGPKGAGALFLRRGVAIEPLIHGGEQERGLRASTENVAGAVGLAAALTRAIELQAAETRRVSALRDLLYELIRAALPDVVMNGSPESRLPGHLHLSIPHTDIKTLIPLLDLNGVEASAGSACTAGSFVDSHVLKAIGTSPELLHGSLRLTLGRETVEEDVVEAARRIIETVCSLRRDS